MKRTLLTLVTLALAFTGGVVSAQKSEAIGFFSIAEVRDANEGSQRTYVAGANDMLASILLFMATSEKSYEEDAAELSRLYKCLGLRSQNLGAMHWNAVAKWGDASSADSRKVNAASYLLTTACK
jgi:hypothetical protein